MIAIGPTTAPLPPKKDWTVLVWAASDNNLYPYEIGDLDKMERVGPSDTVNLLATVDHAPNPDPQGPHTMQRLELQRDDQPGLHSLVKAEAAQGNMADPAALADFVRWGVKNYPAEHYWLVISDHGDAWQGACQDDTHQAWMSLPGIQQALSQARQDTGQKLDLVSFDCCYMASTEVAHQLQGEARYLVGSQEAMGYEGLDYQRLLPEIGKLEPKQLATRLVEISAKNPDDVETFAAIDLDKMPAVSRSLQHLGQAILASPKSGKELRDDLAGSQAFWDYRDTVDLADHLSRQSPNDAALQRAAEEVRAATGQAVFAERHNSAHPGAHGLQVAITTSPSPEGIHIGHLLGNQAPLKTFSNGYSDLAFAGDTGWEKVIERIQS